MSRRPLFSAHLIGSQGRMLGTVLAVASLVFFAAAEPVMASPNPGTSCSSCPGYCYDWVQQWTSNSSHLYRPGSGCPENDAYFGWIGINAQIVTPPHLPSLRGSNSNHSLGWINISFSPSGWVQIG